VTSRTHILSAALCLLFAVGCAQLPPPDGAASGAAPPYDYPFDNPWTATVLGTPAEFQVQFPADARIDRWNLKVFEDREVPEGFWHNDCVRYSTLLQDHEAPLVFVIAGTGADDQSRHMLMLGQVLHAAGMHVVLLPSPTHANFIVNASATQLPGYPESDAADLLNVMRLIDDRLRGSIGMFFLNLGEISIFTNSVLQASPDKATPTLGRFMINSTIGLFGLFDVATELGVPRQIADFGQTLAVWGTDTGPYLVLPALGPSNMRDAVGTAVDWATLSFAIPGSILDKTLYDYAPIGFQEIDTRYQVPFRYHSTGSPFEYELVRYAATIARKVQINSPSPPPE
jgi:hypothetical protein